MLITSGFGSPLSLNGEFKGAGKSYPRPKSTAVVNVVQQPVFDQLAGTISSQVLRDLITRVVATSTSKSALETFLNGPRAIPLVRQGDKSLQITLQELINICIKLIGPSKNPVEYNFSGPELLAIHQPGSDVDKKGVLTLRLFADRETKNLLQEIKRTALDAYVLKKHILLGLDGETPYGCWMRFSGGIEVVVVYDAHLLDSAEGYPMNLHPTSEQDLCMSISQQGVPVFRVLEGNRYTNPQELHWRELSLGGQCRIHPPEKTWHPLLRVLERLLSGSLMNSSAFVGCVKHQKDVNEVIGEFVRRQCEHPMGGLTGYVNFLGLMGQLSGGAWETLSEDSRKICLKFLSLYRFPKQPIFAQLNSVVKKDPSQAHAAWQVMLLYLMGTHCGEIAMNRVMTVSEKRVLTSFCLREPFHFYLFPGEKDEWSTLQQGLHSFDDLLKKTLFGSPEQLQLLPKLWRVVGNHPWILEVILEALSRFSAEEAYFHIEVFKSFESILTPEQYQELLIKLIQKTKKAKGTLQGEFASAVSASCFEYIAKMGPQAKEFILQLMELSSSKELRSLVAAWMAHIPINDETMAIALQKNSPTALQSLNPASMTLSFKGCLSLLPYINPQTSPEVVFKCLELFMKVDITLLPTQEKIRYLQVVAKMICQCKNFSREEGFQERMRLKIVACQVLQLDLAATLEDRLKAFSEYVKRAPEEDLSSLWSICFSEGSLEGTEREAIELAIVFFKHKKLDFSIMSQWFHLMTRMGVDDVRFLLHFSQAMDRTDMKSWKPEEISAWLLAVSQVEAARKNLILEALPPSLADAPFSPNKDLSLSVYLAICDLIASKEGVLTPRQTVQVNATISLFVKKVIASDRDNQHEVLEFFNLLDRVKTEKLKAEWIKAKDAILARIGDLEARLKAKPPAEEVAKIYLDCDRLFDYICIADPYHALDYIETLLKMGEKPDLAIRLISVLKRMPNKGGNLEEKVSALHMQAMIISTHFAIVEGQQESGEFESLQQQPPSMLVRAGLTTIYKMTGKRFNQTFIQQIFDIIMPICQSDRTSSVATSISNFALPAREIDSHAYSWTLQAIQKPLLDTFSQAPNFQGIL